MNRLRLALSILRSNKMFSVALLSLYAMMMALLTMVVVLNPTLDETFAVYLDDYRMPDAFITTEMASADAANDMRKLDGVVDAEARFVMDVPTKLPDGSHVTLRYFSVDPNTFLKYYDAANARNVACEDASVMVSAYFAQVQDLKVGDSLTLHAHDGESIEITDIVSCPETIGAARDENAWYDATDFGYVYVARPLYDDLFATEGFANQFLLRLADAHLEDEDLLEEASKCGEITATDSFLYKGSLVEKQIHASLDTAKAVAGYLPAVILIIGALMSALFIYQVVRSCTRWIGLLGALGYSPAGILLNFIVYTLLLAMAAIAVGAVAGTWLLNFICAFYQDFYFLPYIIYRLSPLQLIGLPLVIVGIGLVSCIFSVRQIASVDPTIAYGGALSKDDSSLPAWLGRVHLSSYGKITLCFMYRNMKRIVLSALCIASCMMLLVMALSFDISKNEAALHTFGERLQYDFLVHATGDDALHSVAALDVVDAAEDVYIFSADIGGERVQLNALKPGSALVCLADADGNACFPQQEGILLEEGFAHRQGLDIGDTVEVEGKELRVTGIAREFVYCICYVSPDQAAALGHDEANALLVRLEDGANREDFLQKLADIEGFSHAVDTRNQERDMAAAMGILDYPAAIFIAFAVLIGLIIICNMMILSVSERYKEYATLLVLGAEDARFLRMVSAETLCYYLLACIIGCPLGMLVSHFVLLNIGSATQDFPMVDVPFVLIAACLITLAYMVLSVGYVMRAVARIRPEDALNER